MMLPFTLLAPFTSLYVFYRIVSFMVYNLLLPWAINMALPHLSGYPTVQYLGSFIAN